MQTQTDAKPNGRKLIIEDKSEPMKPPVQTSAAVLKVLPIEAFVESPSNPRKDFNRELLAELAADIGLNGLQQPVKARPLPGGKYELIFGHRRLRAGKLAGLKELPALVEEMDDQKADVVRVIENTKRADLKPMEESDGLKTLQQKHKMTVEQIAEKVGKSTRTVRVSLQLQKLGPEGRKALEEGKLDASRGMLVARFPAGLQSKAVKHFTTLQYGELPPSYRECLEWSQKEAMIDLRSAPFDLKDAELAKNAGPCTTCPKRTGNAPELFDDVKNAQTCTDKACYELKIDRFLELQSEASGVKVLSEAASAKLFTRWGELSSDDYVKADAKHPEDSKDRGWSELVAEDDAKKLSVLARAPDGGVIELFKTDGLKEAVKKADKLKKRTKEKTQSYSAPHLTKAAKEKRDKADDERGLRKKVANAAITALMERIEKKGMKRQLLQFTAQRLLSDSDFYYGESRGYGAMDPPERRGWKKPDDAAAALAKMKEPELLAFIFETAMGWSLGAVHEGYSVELKESLKAVGLDLKKFESDEKQLAKDEAKAIASMEKDLQAQMDAAAKKKA